jgi:tetratricopeptide (TPR) repeat protein
MDRLTGGLGWENKSLRIDYAFAPSDALGVRQRLDVGWKFGSVFPQEERQTLLWAQAQEAVEDGRWLKARALLEDLRALSPSFYPAKRLLRVVEGRMAQSLDPETLFLLGHTALEAGEYGKSADYLRKLLLLKPGHAEAQADLRRAESADAERRAARIEKEIAQETAQEILRLERRAGKLRASGSWEEALAASGRLRELDPARARDGLDQSLGQVQAMAEVADRAGDWETAQRLYRAVGLHRDVRARLEDVDRRLAEQRAARSRDLYSEGLKAYKGGDGPRARALFQEALTLTPEDKALKRALERLVETSPALNGK